MCQNKPISHFVRVVCLLFVLFSSSDLLPPLAFCIFTQFLISLRFDILPPFCLVGLFSFKIELAHRSCPNQCITKLHFLPRVTCSAWAPETHMLFPDPVILTRTPLEPHEHLLIFCAVPSLVHGSRLLALTGSLSPLLPALEPRP